MHAKEAMRSAGYRGAGRVASGHGSRGRQGTASARALGTWYVYVCMCSSSCVVAAARTAYLDFVVVVVVVVSRATSGQRAGGSGYGATGRRARARMNVCVRESTV